MNFDLTEEQRLLVDTVASFARKQSPLTRLRALRADARGWSPELWKQMGDLGLLGVSLPEAVGGSGGTFADAALILEQLASTLVPEPLLPSLVAAAPILRLGTEEQQARWLAPFAAGDASLALAWAEAQGRFDVTDVETRAEPRGRRLRDHRGEALRAQRARGRLPRGLGAHLRRRARRRGRLPLRPRPRTPPASTSAR